MIDDGPGPGFEPVSYQGAIDWLDAEIERFTLEAIDLMISEGATAAQVWKGLTQLAPIIAKARKRSMAEIDGAFARLQGALH